MKPTYRQCVLRRGEATRVGHIPSQFAIVGQIVNLRLKGKKSKGWLITYAGDDAVESGTRRAKG